MWHNANCLNLIVRWIPSITILAMRTNFELADAIDLFGNGLLAKVNLTPLQQKVLGKIANCRTATLGGHEEHCNNCARCATVTTVVATGIARNVRLPNRHSG